MRYFLVDTENVQQYNFIEDLALSNNDKIIMFKSEKSKKIRFEDLKRITQCDATIEYEDVYTGNTNALDFQLIANLSLIIATKNNEDEEYIVVSNDKDFLLPVKYLKNKTKSKLTILKTDNNSPTTKNKQNENEDKSIDSIYSNLNLDNEVISIIKQSKALDKLHNNLRVKFGNDLGREIYVKVKPHFKMAKA